MRSVAAVADGPPPVRSTAPAGADVTAVEAGRPRDVPAYVVGLLIATLATTFSLMRHANWWSGGLDLGVFDQGVWLMSQGLAPEVTVNGRNLFADHLSPVLVLFVPLYRVWATPFWLFLAQGLAIGATVGPVRALARHEGAPVWAATVAVACAAPLWSAALFDFHPATLAVPFVAGCLLEARRGNSRRAMAFGIAVLVCRTELAWLLVGVAVVATPHVRRRLVALAPVGLAAGFAVPHLLGARGTFGVHYGHLGVSASDALAHPWRLLPALGTVDTVTKLIIWLLPVGFLTARRPRWLGAVVVAGLPLLLSRWAGVSMPWFHYAAPIMPLVLGGAITALGRDTPPPAKGPSPLAIIERHWRTPQLLAGAAVASLVLMGPLSPSAPKSLSLWHVLRPDPRIDFDAAVANVGGTDRLTTSNRVLAHLTHRREAWLWPAPYAADSTGLAADPDPAAAARIDAIVLVGPDAERWQAVLGGAEPRAGEPVDDAITQVDGEVSEHHGAVTIRLP